MRLPDRRPTSSFVRRVPTGKVGLVFGAISAYVAFTMGEATVALASVGQTGHAVLDGAFSLGSAFLAAYNFGIRPGRGRSL